MKTLIVPCSLVLAVAGGCGGDGHDHEASPEEDACEHMIEGPNVEVTASADAMADAPDISGEHTRFDITLPQDGGEYHGYVDIVVAEAGEHILFLDPDVSIKVWDSGGTEVQVEGSGSVDACAEVAVGHTFDVGVGTFLLEVGPDSAAGLVRLVIGAAHEHDSM